MHHPFELIIGIIVSGIFGAYIGNFATNPIYRLPRNEPLFVRDPYCGDCDHKLVRRDLYPVLSWLLSRGKCRYCGAAVPGGYALTEAFIGIIFIICYLKYGFSEYFILVSLGVTAYVMLSMMLYIDNFFSNKTLVTCMVLGMLCRTLGEGTIFNFAGSAFAALMVCAGIWRLTGQTFTRDVKSFPNYLKLGVCAGVWLPLPALGIIFLLSCAVAGRAGKETNGDLSKIKKVVEQAIIVLSALIILLLPYNHFVTHI